MAKAYSDLVGAYKTLLWEKEKEKKDMEKEMGEKIRVAEQRARGDERKRMGFAQ